ATVELLERPPRAIGLAQAHLGDHFIGRERGLEETLEEVGRRDRALTAGAASDDRAAEREHHRREVRCGVAVRERPGERAAVTDLRIADLARRGGEEWDVLREQLAVLDIVMAGEPADRDVITRVPY